MLVYKHDFIPNFGALAGSLLRVYYEHTIESKKMIKEHSYFKF